MKYILTERFILNEADDTLADEENDMLADEVDDTLADEADEDAASEEEPNWEVEFSKAKTAPDINKFWESYYSYYFKTNARIAKNEFHNIISYLTKRFGWAADENPFINFITSQFNTAQLITNAKKLGFDSNLFMKLADATKGDQFKPEHLISSPLGAFDILNNLEFRLIKDDTVFDAWLELRRRAINKKLPILFANCFLLTGPTNPEDALKKPPAAQLVRTGKLLDINKAKQKWSKLAKENLDKKTDANDKTIDQILKGISGDPKTLFYFGYDFFPITNDGCLNALGPEIAKTFKEVRNNQTKALTPDEVAACKKALNFKKVNYSNKVICTLLYKLLEKAGITLPDLPEKTR